MELVALIATAWLVLTVAALAGVAGVCRSGHAEDVARGWDDR